MATFSHPYRIDPKYKRSVAYFCMEYGIDQCLKIYSGGLGYLAGSHMRSAYALKQNVIGIGLLWKYGYYNQVRRGDGTMDVLFQQRQYSFLQDTGITLEVEVNKHPVRVKVFYLPPDIFKTAPLFLLSTDHPENDFLARTITQRLYDSNMATKIAQYIVLGVGGVKLLEQLGVEPEVYHFNEAHALPGAYTLLERYGSVQEVRRRLVFTTHTPIPAGNEIHDLALLKNMSFFGNLSPELLGTSTIVNGTTFNQTLNALFMSRMANGVSKIHGEVARQMWEDYEGVCPITSITNAQNREYWADQKMYDAAESNDMEDFFALKRACKKVLFDVVADQCGKLFDPDVCTIVWARRFAAYKRADLITKDIGQFNELVESTERPVQIIWAGKPYPSDQGAIGVFNDLIGLSRERANCAVLTGYELRLSRQLKAGADIWLNTPRITKEASGTSGMTAAMNGAINLSTNDGWIPEFAQDGLNAFVIPPANTALPDHQQDHLDLQELYRILNNHALPFYYTPKRWWKMVRRSMQDVVPYFDADRMADEYYRILYLPVDEVAIFRNTASVIEAD